MKKIRVVAVGKLKEKYWSEAVKEYEKRISRFAEFTIKEIDERRTLQEEGKDILQNLKGYVIVCDVGGELITSEGLSETIEKAFLRGNSEVTFVIGSSEGLAEEVKAKADKRVSFGRVTFPHQMMRVILCEQVYRAMTISNGVTYHK